MIELVGTGHTPSCNVREGGAYPGFSGNSLGSPAVTAYAVTATTARKVNHRDG